MKKLLLVTKNENLGSKIGELIKNTGISMTIVNDYQNGIDYVSNGHNAAIIDYTGSVFSSDTFDNLVTSYRTESGKVSLPVAAIVEDDDEDFGWVSVPGNRYTNKLPNTEIFDSTASKSDVLHFLNKNYK